MVYMQQTKEYFWLKKMKEGNSSKWMYMCYTADIPTLIAITFQKKEGFYHVSQTKV